jgi:hypothetical protein
MRLDDKLEKLIKNNQVREQTGECEEVLCLNSEEKEEGGRERPEGDKIVPGGKD